MYPRSMPRLAAGCNPAVATAAVRPFSGEPNIADLLRDPITRALMAADRIGGHEMRTLLATARGRLSRAA